MGDKSLIEWTDATLNVVSGCTKVSPACAYCYIERSMPFVFHGRKFVHGSTDVQLHPNRIDQPRRWTKGRRIFVCSLGDLFHDEVPDEYLDDVFAMMAMTPQHTYQVLTKRPERAFKYLSSRRLEIVEACARSLRARGVSRTSPEWDWTGWPLPNVWIGATVENQAMLAARWPYLEATPAAVRFLSIEPLFGEIDLRLQEMNEAKRPGWVIVGGESAGPDYRALVSDVKGLGVIPKKTAHVAVSAIRDQCVVAGVPFFFKQWGGAKPKSGGRVLDGRTWSQFPGMNVRAGEGVERA